MVPFGRFAAVLILTSACERGGSRPAAEVSQRTAASEVGAAVTQPVVDTGERLNPHTRVVAEAPPGLPPRFARAPGPCTGEMHTSSDYERESRFVEERTRFGVDSLVVRDAETLLVRTLGGLELIFKDCDADNGEMNVRYVYHGRGPRGRGHLIERWFYEGGDWLWVHDSTGEEQSLVLAPAFSPDSAHFAVANVDLHAEYSPNVFEVWEVRGSSIARVLDVALGERVGARDAKWMSVREVQASRIELDANSDEAVRGTFRALNTRGRWVVASAPP